MVMIMALTKVGAQRGYLAITAMGMSHRKARGRGSLVESGQVVSAAKVTLEFEGVFLTCFGDCVWVT